LLQNMTKLFLHIFLINGQKLMHIIHQSNLSQTFKPFALNVCRNPSCIIKRFNQREETFFKTSPHIKVYRFILSENPTSKFQNFQITRPQQVGE